MSNRLIEWCRRHTIRTNLIVLGSEIIGVCIIWFIFHRIEEFPTLANFAIVCLSVVIASIAALNSMFASVAAHDSFATTTMSLELTRATTRPFLLTSGSISVKKTGNYLTLTFKIQNSGSLPGNDVHVDIDFFDEDEEVTEDNLSKKYLPPTREPELPLVFPNNPYYETYILDLQDRNDLELWENIQKGKTKCRVRITYRSLDREHITIQTEKIAKREWEEGLTTTPIPPQKWT